MKNTQMKPIKILNKYLKKIKSKQKGPVLKYLKLQNK